MTGNTVVCIYQMRYLIALELNLVRITSTKLALIGQLSQFQNISIGRSFCGALLLYICISLVIQRLRRHYTLTGLRDNVLFLCTVDVTGQRRDQQSCQDRQDNQDYDQLYQRKAALLAAALLLQRDHFFHHDLVPPNFVFLFFYLCKPRRCSAGLHFFFYAAGRCCAVTPVLTGMSYRRSMRSESEKTASVISASRKMVTVAVTVRPDSSSSKYRPARRPM